MRALDTARQRILTRSLLTAAVIVLFFGAITLVLWVGAKDVLSNTLDAGVLTQFLFYAMFSAGALMGFVGRMGRRVARPPVRWSESANCLANAQKSLARLSRWHCPVRYAAPCVSTT